MADFSINNTSQDYGYGNNTTNSHSDDPEFYSKVIYVVTCVITPIGLLLTTVAIYSLYTLVRKDHVAPIYVVNLLISDLIQLCCFIPLVTDSGSEMRLIIVIIYFYSLMVSICFMVCIALARYLVIARPLWYRFRHTIKFSVVLCVMVWVLSPVSYFMITFLIGFRNGRIAVGTFFLLPLPLFIFFLGGTIRALSASRVPSDEKRRIVGVLVLVLLIYTLLFLPAIILSMTEKDIHHLPLVANVFLRLSPLADLFLYVFMRKGTIDKFLASVCCCRMDSNDSSRMDSNDITSSTV